MPSLGTCVGRRLRARVFFAPTRNVAQLAGRKTRDAGRLAFDAAVWVADAVCVLAPVLLLPAAELLFSETGRCRGGARDFLWGSESWFSERVHVEAVVFGGAFVRGRGGLSYFDGVPRLKYGLPDWRFPLGARFLGLAKRQDTVTHSRGVAERIPK